MATYTTLDIDQATFQRYMKLAEKNDKGIINLDELDAIGAPRTDIALRDNNDGTDYFVTVNRIYPSSANNYFITDTATNDPRRGLTFNIPPKLENVFGQRIVVAKNGVLQNPYNVDYIKVDVNSDGIQDLLLHVQGTSIYVFMVSGTKDSYIP